MKPGANTWLSGLVSALVITGTTVASLSADIHHTVRDEVKSATASLTDTIAHRMENAIAVITHRADTVTVRAIGTISDSLSHQLAAQPKPREHMQTLIVAAPPDLARDSARDEAVARMNYFAHTLLMEMIRNRTEQQAWRTEMRKRGIAAAEPKAQNNGH